MHEFLYKAIEKAGGEAALAAALTKILKRKIWQSHVNSWKRRKRGVPAECCPALEKFTGIPRRKFRPDIYGSA